MFKILLQNFEILIGPVLSIKLTLWNEVRLAFELHYILRFTHLDIHAGVKTSKILLHKCELPKHIATGPYYKRLGKLS